MNNIFLKNAVKVFLSCLIFSLASCANIDKFTDADFGSHKGYKEKIKHILVSSAKNPDSIKIRYMSEPKKTLVQNTSLDALWNPYFPAYGVCVKYSGTNSYGAVMTQTENFYIRNGEVAYDYVASANGKSGYDLTTPGDEYKPCLMK